jgi:hypothetical protein
MHQKLQLVAVVIASSLDTLSGVLLLTLLVLLGELLVAQELGIHLRTACLSAPNQQKMAQSVTLIMVCPLSM